MPLFKKSSHGEDKISPSLAITATLSIAVGMTCLTANAVNLYDKDGTSFDVFGQIRATFMNDNAVHEYVGHDFNEDTVYADAEFGIAGRTQIAHGLDGIMMANWNTRAFNKGGDLGQVDYMFVGLDAYQYGTLIFGRGDSAFYGVVGATDIYNMLDGHAADYYLYGDRRDSQIMYSLRALGWDLKASYQLSSINEYGQTDIAGIRNYSLSVSTAFAHDITFSYGYDYYKFDFQRNRVANEEFFAYMLAADQKISYAQALERTSRQHINSKQDIGLSLSYGTFGKDLYAAMVLVMTDYDYLSHKLYTIDTALQYSFENGLDLSLGYGRKTLDDIAIISELNLGINYNLNSQFRIFAEAQFDINGEANKFYSPTFSKSLNLNEDKYALGMALKF